MEDLRHEFIRGREKLLVVAEHEKIRTAVASVIALAVTTAAVIFSWPTWGVAMAGLTFGWFVARHLRARRFIDTVTRSIARLRV